MVRVVISRALAMPAESHRMARDRTSRAICFGARIGGEVGAAAARPPAGPRPPPVDRAPPARVVDRRIGTPITRWSKIQHLLGLHVGLAGHAAVARRRVRSGLGSPGAGIWPDGVGGARPAGTAALSGPGRRRRGRRRRPPPGWWLVGEAPGARRPPLAPAQERSGLAEASASGDPRRLKTPWARSDPTAMDAGSLFCGRERCWREIHAGLRSWEHFHAGGA